MKKPSSKWSGVVKVQTPLAGSDFLIYDRSKKILYQEPYTKEWEEQFHDLIEEFHSTRRRGFCGTIQKFFCKARLQSDGKLALEHAVNWEDW